MAQEIHRTQDDDANPQDSNMGISDDLKSLINSCNDVEEMRSLLQEHGIWLNRKAAESAFYSLHNDQGEELDDAALGAVTGGVRTFSVNNTFLNELIHCL